MAPKLPAHETLLIPWVRSAGPSPPEFPATPVTWEDLAEGACRSGLAGIVLKNTAACRRDVPRSATEQLRAAAMTVAATNLNLLAEMRRLARAFHQAGVPLMLLKGAALNLSLYDSPELRPMDDLDLLIRPQQVGVALEVLERIGCRKGRGHIRDDFFPKYYYESEFLTGGRRPIRIDLHVRPFRPLRLAQTMPDDALWHGARRVLTGDATALIPKPELMLLHLAGHAAFHGCSRLLWLLDIKRLVDAHGSALDWAEIVARARQWHLSFPLLRAMTATQAALGPACPIDVTRQLARLPVGWRDRLTLWEAPRDAGSPLAHVVVNLISTHGIRFPAGYLLAHLLPGCDHLAEMYPWRHPGWQFCAHLWRVLRRPLKFVRAAARSLWPLLTPCEHEARRWAAD